MTSVKTTICGILAIVGAGLNQFFPEYPIAAKIGLFLAFAANGVGLLFARDNNVTSEQAGLKPSRTINGIPILIALLCLPLAGCGTLNPSGVYAGDKLLYDADTAIVASYDTLHDFVKWELENRDELKAYPEIKQSADAVRLNARDWISAAIGAREAYTHAPGTDTRSALEKAVAVLRSALVSAVKIMATHKQ